MKTSFTISKETLTALERLVGKNGNRSAFVETALNTTLRQRERDERDARDAAIYEKHAAEIDREVEDSMVLVADLTLMEARRRSRANKRRRRKKIGQ